MRDKQVVGGAVAVAAVSVAVGFVLASAGGVFDDSDYVRPPSIDYSNSGAVISDDASSSTSAAVSVPPSPTWRVAPENAPRSNAPVPTTETETSTTRPERTTRPTRERSTRTSTTTAETSTSRPGR